MHDGLERGRAEAGGDRPDHGRARPREVADWMRASGADWQWLTRISIGTFAVGLSLMCLGTGIPHASGLEIVGVVALGCATLAGLLVNRGAVRWRRTHPFDAWKRPSR